MQGGHRRRATSSSASASASSAAPRRWTINDPARARSIVPGARSSTRTPSCWSRSRRAADQGALGVDVRDPHGVCAASATGATSRAARRSISAKRSASSRRNRSASRALSSPCARSTSAAQRKSRKRRRWNRASTARSRFVNRNTVKNAQGELIVMSRNMQVVWSTTKGKRAAIVQAAVRRPAQGRREGQDLSRRSHRRMGSLRHSDPDLKPRARCVSKI